MATMTTASELIGVEHEHQQDMSIVQLLNDYHVYIPDVYHSTLIHSGIMLNMLKIIIKTKRRQEAVLLGNLKAKQKKRRAAADDEHGNKNRKIETTNQYGSESN